MREIHINYVNRKFSIDKLRVDVEFNEVVHSTETDELGEITDIVLSSDLIEHVLFILPIDYTDEQIDSELNEYLTKL